MRCRVYQTTNLLFCLVLRFAELLCSFAATLEGTLPVPVRTVPRRVALPVTPDWRRTTQARQPVHPTKDEQQLTGPLLAADWRAAVVAKRCAGRGGGRGAVAGTIITGRRYGTSYTPHSRDAYC